MFGPQNYHVKKTNIASQAAVTAVQYIGEYAGKLYQWLKSPFTPKSNEASVVVPSSKMEIGVEELPYIRKERSSAELAPKASRFNSAEALEAIQGAFHAAVDPIVNRYNKFHTPASVAGFDDFLADKAELKAKGNAQAPEGHGIHEADSTKFSRRGFTAADKLRFAYVDYKEAQGFAKVVAWFKLGGLGALVAGDFDESSYEFEKLKAQADFYKNVCKAESAFAKFNKKPDAAKYDAAVKAFEEMLADENRDSITAFENMNLILNNQTGHDVARALIEYGAEQALKKDGKFTQENFLDTFRANSFLQKVDELYEKGYRPGSKQGERDRIEALYPQGASDSELNHLIGHDLAPIFMAYGKVYQSIIQSKEGEANKLMVLRTITSQKVDLDTQANNEIKRNNVELFKFIQSSSEKVDVNSTQFGISGEIINDMVEVYNGYLTTQESLKHAKALKSVAKKNLKDAQADLDAFMKETNAYTMTELAQLYGDNPVANLYSNYKKSIDQDEAALAGAEQNIRDRIKAINTYLNGDGLGVDGLATTKSAIEEMKKLEEQVAEAKAKVQSTHKEKQKLLDQIASRKVDAFEEQTEATAAEQMAVVALTQQHRNILANYNSSLGMLEHLQSTVKILQDELKQLEGNDIKHGLIKERDEKNKQVIATKSLKIILSNSVIIKIPENHTNSVFTKIRVQGIKLERVIHECDNELKEIKQDLKEAPKALVEFRVLLERFGFKFNKDEVVGLNYNFDRDAMKAFLEKDSRVSRLVFSLLHDFNKSVDTLLNEAALVERVNQQVQAEQKSYDLTPIETSEDENGELLINRRVSYLEQEQE